MCGSLGSVSSELASPELSQCCQQHRAVHRTLRVKWIPPSRGALSRHGRRELLHAPERTWGLRRRRRPCLARLDAAALRERRLDASAGVILPENPTAMTWSSPESKSQPPAHNCCSPTAQPDGSIQVNLQSWLTEANLLPRAQITSTAGECRVDARRAACMSKCRGFLATWLPRRPASACQYIKSPFSAWHAQSWLAMQCCPR